MYYGDWYGDPALFVFIIFFADKIYQIFVLTIHVQLLKWLYGKQQQQPTILIYLLFLYSRRKDGWCHQGDRDPAAHRIGQGKSDLCGSGTNLTYSYPIMEVNCQNINHVQFDLLTNYKITMVGNRHKGTFSLYCKKKLFE